MTIKHFPPVFESFPEGQLNIFLPFSKIGGKCPTIILANFQKWEENVLLSSWQTFKNGWKISKRHSGEFLKMGGKCPTAIMANSQKW